MGLPAIATGLTIASAGVGIVTGIAGAVNANQQAEATTDAAKKQVLATTSEINRQQEEVNRTSVEQTSDRIRAADAELATARVAALERGVSGTTMGAIVRQIGYLEGADLSRIESNRASNIAAGEASKVSAKNGYIETVTIAGNQKNVAMTSAILGTVGSGLSIAGNYYQNQSQLEALKNHKV